MKLTKKEAIFFILSVILGIIVISSFIYLNFFNESPTEKKLPGVIFYSPEPTQESSIPAPTSQSEDLVKEKVLQENYAKSREEFLAEKPWITKLPLKSTFYFISYDPETDSMLATVYYYSGVAVDRAQQIEDAKQKAISAMTDVGIDVKNQKIIYTETEGQ